ncbi:MAG: response regulator transcription factor [Clostridia bacterium]|nr:response regulator transcription factor [Clostridia bacterium]NCC44252.1 response regulator transcription factor [Clostridia bacterium]
MYKIGICDDEVITCTELEKYISDISQELNIRVSIGIWYFGEKLIEYLEQSESLDFLILDIELFRTDGIDVGRYLREVQRDYKIQIIYISSKSNYAIHLFEVQPLDFLIKPIEKRRLKTAIERGIQYIGDREQYFEYQKGYNVYRIKCNEILYFASDKRKIKIVYSDNSVEYYGKLKDIRSGLPSNFALIHQSYIINLNYVKEYSYSDILMADGTLLGISKAYRADVRKQVLSRRKSQ